MNSHRRPPIRFGQILALARDFSFVTFGRYGQYLVTLVTLPLTARVLGTEGLGLLAVAMSSYFIGSIVGDLGIPTYMAARITSDSVIQWRSSYAAVRVTIVIGMGVALLASIAVGAQVHIHMILLGLLCGGFASVSDDWVLLGQGRFGASMAYQVIGRIGYLVLLVVLLPRYPHPSTPMICMLVAWVPTVLLTWYDTIRSLGWPPYPRKVLDVLRMGVPVVTSRLLGASYGQGSTTIYSTVLDATSLGLFTASDRLVRAVQTLLDPIGYTVLPRLARHSDASRFWRRSMFALTLCLITAAVATAALFLAAPIVVRLVFGAEFLSAVAILRVEALILPAAAVTSYVTVAVLTVRRDTVGVLIGAIIGTCIAAAALAIATQTHSVWTLVYGTLAAEISVAAWYVVRLRQLFVREHRGRRKSR